jgi:hypothetical protein
MALTDIGLAARALIKIGAHPIAAFDEGTVEAEVAGHLYAPVKDALLSAHPWRFADRQTKLTRLATEPAADFAEAYQLPKDFLRAISLGAEGRGRGAAYRLRAQLEIKLSDFSRL